MLDVEKWNKEQEELFELYFKNTDQPTINALEYVLGGLSNNIFASTYTYYIPNKEQLINEVEKVLENNK